VNPAWQAIHLGASLSGTQVGALSTHSSPLSVTGEAAEMKKKDINIII